MTLLSSIFIGGDLLKVGTFILSKSSIKLCISVHNFFSSLDSEVYQGQGGRVISELNVDTARSHVPVSCGPAPPTPPLFQEPEPFVPPKELEVPNGMEIVSIAA